MSVEHSHRQSQHNGLLSGIKEIAKRVDNYMTVGPLFIRVAGASGAGKTTFGSLLTRSLPGVSEFNMDGYMLGKTFVKRLLIEDPSSFGWDDPRNFDLDNIGKDLNNILRGKNVLIPTFNRVDGEKNSNLSTFTSNYIVVIEGIHALNEVLDFCGGLSVFINAPLHDRLWRRVIRNHRESSYNQKNVGNIIKNYLSRVEPSYLKHIQSNQHKADIVIDNPSQPTREFQKLSALIDDTKINWKISATLKPKSLYGIAKPGELISIAEVGSGLVLQYSLKNKPLIIQQVDEEILHVLEDYYDLK